MKAERGERTGALVPIGGNEDRKGDLAVLKAVLGTVPEGLPRRVAVMTAASQVAERQWKDYQVAFGTLDAEPVWLDVRSRADAEAARVLDEVRQAGVFFMTGGDQERLTALLHGTALHRLVAERHRDAGLTVAGTSAGASAIAGFMPCSVEVEGAALELCDHDMPHGLGLVTGVVIDQHFSQRERLSRLIGFACSQGGLLGLGIDEDTALVLRPGSMEVVGKGTVTVVDCRTAAHSSPQAKIPSLRNLSLHTLRTGTRIDADADPALAELLP